MREHEKNYIKEPQALLIDRKYKEEQPWSCMFCYFWAGKKKGCELDRCHYLVTEQDIYDEMEMHPDDTYGDCKKCVYGRQQPCIGYCIAKLQREMRKERR